MFNDTGFLMAAICGQPESLSAQEYQMRPFERRAASAYPYFKLARWDALNATWREIRQAYPTEQAARNSAVRGRFRISEVSEVGYRDVATIEN